MPSRPELLAVDEMRDGKAQTVPDPQHGREPQELVVLGRVGEEEAAGQKDGRGVVDWHLVLVAVRPHTSGALSEQAPACSLRPILIYIIRGKIGRTILSSRELNLEMHLHLLDDGLDMAYVVRLPARAGNRRKVSTYESPSDVPCRRLPRPRFAALPLRPQSSELTSCASLSSGILKVGGL